MAGILVVFLCGSAASVEYRRDSNLIIPDSASGSIKIDGELNEEAWQRPPLAEKFITFLPVYGEVLELATEVWLAYDGKNLYFAFMCHDPEPGRIKTSIARRDNTGIDDWIGVIIDGLGNRQATSEFYVNPSGIQTDGITSAVKPDTIDLSPDFVWDSAAKITASGYQVEIRLPLDCLRFRGGKEVKMGIMFMRYVSRLGRMGAWPEIKVGQNQFHFLASIVYPDLQKMLSLELLPNFTYNLDRVRQDGGGWGEYTGSRNLGASVKYGLTSAITAEATVNPDFSQVESDAFQVEVNQRYPLFYSEKRPFFMEGMNAFDFGLINQSVMQSPVYTRYIVNPDWAVKFSGTTGKTLFSFLAANDAAPGGPWLNAANPDQGFDTLWSVGRAKTSLGSDNSIGLLYSGRHFAGGWNVAAGADMQYRFFKSIRLTLSYLYSGTKSPPIGDESWGSGLSVMLQYSSRALSTWAAFERFDRNFRMDSAFMDRTGISKGIFSFAPCFYPRSKKWSALLQLIQPFFRYMKLHDLGSGMDDDGKGVGLLFYTVRSGFLRLEYRDEKEAWAGAVFHMIYGTLAGHVQLNKWLFFQVNFRSGEKIYYRPVAPYLGSGYTASVVFNLQPTVKLNMDLAVLRDTLDRGTAGKKERIYAVDIFNCLATYQFNRNFFVRAALRYTDYPKKLLTDFLASFTLIPGTVVHLGYGSLHEAKEWGDDGWLTTDGQLLTMRRSFFFKVSYLWRVR